MIKGIIFDLDDTLFDCTGTLVDAARKRAAKAMEKAGFPLSSDKIYGEINRLSSEMGAKADVFGFMCRDKELDERKTDDIVTSAVAAYNSDTIDTEIKLFDDAIPTLKALKKDFKLALITSGAYSRQKKKVELLKLEDYFDVIFIDSEEGKTKTDYFNDFLDRFSLKAKEVVSIGDRVASEIKAGNRLGMITIQMLHGRHKNVTPKSDLEEPDYRITKISQAISIIDSIRSKEKSLSDLNIVCIGGGTGMPTVLEGLKKYTKNLTAVVGVTDSGRSSGMLRKDMGIPPPGDIRNCLIALSGSEKLLNDLFQYRFTNGLLEGHSLGNLLIAGLSEVTGNFEKAINEVSKILNIEGDVVPVSLEDTHLCAERKDGTIYESEDKITERFVKGKCDNPIKRIFLKEETKVNPKAVDSIRNADCIIIGPGSLYVSVLNNFLHKDIRDAINQNRNAKKIYVCNIVTQPFQTDDFTASSHVKEVLKYLEGKLDYALVNTKVPDKSLLKKYEEDHSFIVKDDSSEIDTLGVKPVEADIIEEIKEKRILYAKRELLRHDSDKIAKEIIKIFNSDIIKNQVSDLKLRKAKKDDANEIGTVLNVSFNIDSIEEGKKIFLDESDSSNYIVAESEGKIAGFVSWKMHHEPKHELAELDRIGILPEFRGIMHKDKSIGKHLFEALIEDACKTYKKYGQNLRKLYLLVHADNTRARKFYEKCGMKMEATLPSHLYPGRDECVYSVYFDKEY
ncbi:MAG: uridine diphosphate-N-acetylglucosamine-binding protein YvcK [Candidatus Woesearchaeota archaeon]